MIDAQVTQIQAEALQQCRETFYALGWLLTVTGVVSAVVVLIATTGNALTEAFWWAVTLPVSLRKGGKGGRSR